MATKAKAETKVKRQYLKHTEVAERQGVTAETLRNWVARGEWPLPHSIVGVLWFYRKADVEHYDAHGAWPEGMGFRAGMGKGRAGG